MSESQFRRYTTLPYLLDILQEQRLTLLNPANWEDKNDAYFLELYKAKKKLKAIRVLCFADAHETYQHWKIYSGNASGVCIIFDKERILSRLGLEDGYYSGTIKYKTIEDLNSEKLYVDELPFIKRYPFVDEKEYRIIFESPIKSIKVKHLPILPNDIRMIVINPWVDNTTAKSIESTIKMIRDCGKIQIRKSTVTENEFWKKIGENAVYRQQHGLTEDEVKIVEGKL